MSCGYKITVVHYFLFTPAVLISKAYPWHTDDVNWNQREVRKVGSPETTVTMDLKIIHNRSNHTWLDFNINITSPHHTLYKSVAEVCLYDCKAGHMYRPDILENSGIDNIRFSINLAPDNWIATRESKELEIHIRMRISEDSEDYVII